MQAKNLPNLENLENLENPAQKSRSKILKILLKKAALRHPMNINIIILTPRITPNDDGFPFTGRNRLW